MEVAIFRHWAFGGWRNIAGFKEMSTVVAKFKWLFPLVDGCHCGHITNLRGKKSLQLTATKQCHSTLVFCIARLLPLQSSPQVSAPKKNNFSN
jgi:hypothetical protein